MKFFWLFLLMIYCVDGVAQNTAKADSLLRILNTTTIDSVKLRMFTELGTSLVKSNPGQALKYSKDGIALAQSTGLLQLIPELYFNLGYAFYSVGGIDSAMIYLNKCLGFSEGRNNTRLQMQSLNLIGFIYTTQSKYKESAEALFRALGIGEASKNADLTASIYSSLSVLFYNQTNYEKAIVYGEKGLAILKKDGDPKSLGSSYLNVGLIYADKHDSHKAEEYYKNALALFKQVDANLHIATTYGNLSLLPTIDINEKIAYLMEAQKIWNEFAPEYPNAVGNLGNLGAAYLAATYDTNFVQLKAGNGIVKDKNFLLSKAEQLLTEACEKCRKLDFDRDLHYFTGELAKVEEAKGNYKLANKYLNEFIVLNDSIYSQENKNKIAAVEGEREVAIRDKEIELNKLSISAQRKVRVALIAGLFLLAVIGAMLYWLSRSRKRANTTLLRLNNELDEANKVKARFFGIISHDLRSPVANLVSFLNLQQEEPELFSKEQAALHRSAIKTSAESLLETMEAMLQWSKSQMDNFKPQLKSTSVDELFQHIRMNFPDTDALKITVQNPKGLWVYTDENYLKTILQNLTANASKALHQQPNGIIDWKAYEENGHTILSITDNGPGAAEQQIEALYNKQAAVTGKNGLGLHLIRDLASAIHCVIGFSSTPGSGTTFRLTLT